MSVRFRVTATAAVIASTAGSVFVGANPAAAAVTPPHICPPGMHWVPADNACDDNTSGGGGGGSGGGGAAAASFTWSVSNRTIDRGDGVVDESISLDPSNTALVLDGCGSSGGGSRIVTYTWWTSTGQSRSGSDCHAAFSVPLDGTWTVSLTVRTADNTSVATSQSVDWHDYFIASLGDSAASGEGVPDTASSLVFVPPLPNDPAAAGWANLRCDRSGRAASAQAALRLENGDPHTSVTFLHLACSGAAITGDTNDPNAYDNGHYTGGVLTPYDGQIRPGTEHGGPALTLCPPVNDHTTPCVNPVPPQIATLAEQARTANRPLDALYMTLGADDTRWSDLFEDCFTVNKIIPGHCETVYGPGVAARLQSLPSRYAALAAALSALTLPDGRQIIPANRIFISEYYDPTHDELGFDPLCFHDPPAPNAGDRQWGYDNIVAPLNAAVAQAAQANGWNLVTGIASDFREHGDCSFSPWVNSLQDSNVLQADPLGIWHPNPFGQANITQHLLSASTPTLNAQAAELSFDGDAVARHSGKCLDVSAASTADGANVQQWSCSGGENQRWRLVPTDSGFYELVVQHSGKCLDVSGAGTADAANVQQRTCASGQNQQWRPVATDSGFYELVARHSGKCLDVSGVSTADGANVQQWSCSGGQNQQWRIG